MEWISVEDRLPDENCPVLVWGDEYADDSGLKDISESGAAVCIYKSDKMGSWWAPEWVSGYEWEFYLKNITHWMPLPEPPK